MALLFLLLPLWMWPGSEDAFHEPKWTFLFFVVPWFTLFAKFQIKFDLPKAARAIAPLVCAYGMSFLQHASVVNLYQQMAWGLFLLLVLYSSSCKPQRLLQSTRIFNRVGALLLLIHLCLQMAGRDSFLTFLGLSDRGSLFGNRNMLAEFFCLSIGWEWISFKESKTKRLVGVLWVLPYLAAMIVLQARAALVGMTLLFVFQICAYFPSYKKKIIAACLVLFSLSLPVILPKLLRPSLAPIVEGKIDKVATNHIRAIRYRNTLAMIAENPWGVGPGNFEFSYRRYHSRYKMDPESTESMIVRSPHSIVLEVGAEIGWLGLVALLWFVGALLHLWMTKPDRSHRFEEILLVTLGMGLFSFPMENSYPFFMCAVALGQVFRRQDGHTNLGSFVKHTLILIMCVNGVRKLMDEKLVFNPWNWRSRLFQAQEHRSKGRTFEAIEILRQGIRLSPDNDLFIKELALSYLDLKDLPKSCDAMKKVDERFQGASSLNAVYEAYCLKSNEP